MTETIVVTDKHMIEALKESKLLHETTGYRRSDKEIQDRADELRKPIELFKLRRKAYEQYCNVTNDNSDTTFETAQKKLTRNIMLSMKVELRKKSTLYIYGHLHIFTNGKNRITWIKNIKNTHDWFYKDEKEYDRLNKLLKIED